MAGEKHRKPAPRPEDKPRKPGRSVVPSQPVDVIDGIADRTRRPALWKHLLLAVIFLGWLAFLTYVALASGG